MPVVSRIQSSACGLAQMTLKTSLSGNSHQSPVHNLWNDIYWDTDYLPISSVIKAA